MRIAPLGDVCRFIGGGTPSRKRPEFFSGGIPWATVKDFKAFRLDDTEEHITEEAVRESAANIVEVGTVLLVTRVGLGKVAMAGCRLAINQDVKGLVPREDILPEYLFWFLVSRAAEIERMGTGATVKGVTLQDIRKIEIPLLPINKQRRIVDLLSRAEGIVRLRRQAQKKTAKIIPALFIDMFGDPATNPKGWPKYRLDDLCEISYGLADKLDTSITAESGCRILTISNVLLDGNIDHSVERFCVVKDGQRDKALVRRGDLLFNWRNGSEQHIGKTAMWESDDHVLHVSFLLRLRPRQDHVSSHFLWALINRLRASGYFINASRQQVNRKFNASELSALEVAVPPITLQKRFESAAESVRAIERQQTNAVEVAVTTFNALVGEMFSESKVVDGECGALEGAV